MPDDDLDYCLHECEETWWRHDAQGIPLVRVCKKCEKHKMSKYRPCILNGYTQEDVDEPIEPEDY